MPSKIYLGLLTERSSNNGRAFNRPLQRNRRLLDEMGVSLLIHYDDPYACGLCECDTLWINSKVFRSWWKDKKPQLFELLERFRSSTRGVCYIDTTDSSGTLQHEVLPYVTRYYKSFLLRDRRLYLKKLYGGRIFTDFYHKEFNINDDEDIPDILGAIVDDRDLEKLELAWAPLLSYAPPRLLPDMLLGTRFVSPGKFRPTPIVCRIGLNYSRRTVQYQREQISALLKCKGVTTAKVGRRAYVRELRQSRIGISPFGWGEFAYRDYEIIMSGALLFKPDMAHLESWPDLYVPDETYVPFRWDLSDFIEKLEGMLARPEAAQACAERAQALLKRYQKGKQSSEEFCTRVATMASQVRV